MHDNLLVFFAHIGEARTDESAQVLTRRNWKRPYILSLPGVDGTLDSRYLAVCASPTRVRNCWATAPIV